MEVKEDAPIAASTVTVVSTLTHEELVEEKCNFCYRTCEFNINVTEDDGESSELIYSSCCRHINPDYLHPEFFSWKHPKPLPFCKKCFHGAKKLSGLNETFEAIQRRIDSFVNSFTVDFLKQRENPNEDFEPNSYGETEPEPLKLPEKDSEFTEDSSNTHINIKEEIVDNEYFSASPIPNEGIYSENDVGCVSNDVDPLQYDAPVSPVVIQRVKKFSRRKKKVTTTIKSKIKDVKVNLRRMEYDFDGNPIPNEELPRRKAAVKAVAMISSWAGKKETAEPNADESDSSRGSTSNWVDNEENNSSDMGYDRLHESSEDSEVDNKPKKERKVKQIGKRSTTVLQKKGNFKSAKEELESESEEQDNEKSTRGFPYKCSDCNKGFSRKWKLNLHSRIHSGERPYTCDQCDMTFMDQYYLNKHQNVHSEVRLFECPECGKSYKHKRNLSEHIRRHDKEGLLVCKICKSSFLYLRLLKKHFLRRHPNKNWSVYKPVAKSRIKVTTIKLKLSKKSVQCQECGKMCLSEQLLAKHAANFHPPEGSEFPCEICSKKFRTPDALRRHMKTHNNQEFPCTSCDKIFKSRGGLKEHAVTHYDSTAPEFQDKVFSCHHCGKVFATNGRLKSHLLMHTDERPFGPCDHCGKSFRSHHALQEHLRGHEGAKAVDCPICHKVLSSKSCLNKHLYLHQSEKQFPCPVCGKKFRTRSQLTAHSIYHKGGKTYLCEECGESFYTGTKLKEHVRVHTGMLYPCEVCDKGFKNTTLLKQHFKTHNKNGDDQPIKRDHPPDLDMNVFTFQCTMCDQSFSSESKLVSHNSVHTEDFFESMIGV